MKKMSLKGLADYMTASSTRKRSILKQYKYPYDDEARAKIIYYREARDIVVAYHASGRDRAWLIDEASRLRSLAAASQGATKTRLNHNARAVRSYADHFADKDFKILDDRRLTLQYDDVTVTVVPELHVLEGDQEKIIKLEFGAKAPDPMMLKIMAQVMLEAADAAHMGLPSSAVLVFDVPRGVAHKEARVGARMRRDIENSCLNISAIWDSI